MLTIIRVPGLKQVNGVVGVFEKTTAQIDLRRHGFHNLDPRIKLRAARG